MKHLFTYLPYLFFALTVAVFVLPRFPRSIRTQACWYMALLLCFSKFLGFAKLGGDSFSPELPALVIWIWDWAYSGAVILMTLATVVWLARLVLRRRVIAAPRRSAAILSVVSWGLALWGVSNGIVVPSVHRVELAFANLPPELDGYRIVQLTDLHASSSAEGWRTRAIVDRANALDADLVCLTGDYVDGPAARADRVEALGDLRARDGVYAVTGNHEYYHGWWSWYAVYRRLGLRFLRNECVFPRPCLALGGVPDIVNVQLGNGAMSNVRKAFAAATNGEFRILLQHRPPMDSPVARAHRADLQLAGHTHGGIAPVLDRLVAAYNGGFVRGEYRLRNGLRLYVSPGCGQWAGFPIRFFDPAEITLITLRREPQP